MIGQRGQQFDVLHVKKITTPVKHDENAKYWIKMKYLDNVDNN